MGGPGPARAAVARPPRDWRMPEGGRWGMVGDPHADALAGTEAGGEGMGRRCGAAGAALVAPAVNLTRFLKRLRARFGRFVLLAVAQYGMNQGIGEPTGELARKLYFSQVLGVDGADSLRYYASAKLPWNMKPVFGMLSDALPIFGYRRTSYVVIAGVSGVIAWTSLGTLPLTAQSAVPFLILMNVSMATPDIMVDATTAELSRKVPEAASDLQSLCWGALAVGGVYSCTTSGAIADAFGPQVLFLTTNVAALSVLIGGLRGWLEEKRLPPQKRRPDLSWFRNNRAMSGLAVFMAASASTLTFVNVFCESMALRAGVTLAIAGALMIAVRICLRTIHPVLARVALFLFAREALQPYVSDALFQWMTKADDGPKFTATFLGFVDCFGNLGLFAGVVLYNTKLTNVNYRRIFTFAQVALCLSNLMDLALVMRWNLAIGIPDHAMLIGDTAVTACIRRFFSMPSFVLASKVCPRDVEATLFAMLMALSNFGTTVAELLGTSLLEFLKVRGDNYDNLSTAITLKSLCRMLPILLIPLLVPNLTPNDPIDVDHGGDGRGDSDGDPEGAGITQGMDSENVRLIDNALAEQGSGAEAQDVASVELVDIPAE